MPKKSKASAPPSSPSLRRSCRGSKRVHYTEYDSDSLESLLEDHERSGIEYRASLRNKGKHPKIDAYTHPGYEIPLDALPALCISRILSFISDPGDLHCLSSLNSTLRSLITAPLVIRCGVFHSLRKKKDAIHRKTLSNIMGYLKNRSIHLPTPLRLLRLLNCTMCERGDDCWGKNLCSGRPSVLDRHSTARPFGMAICNTCLKFGCVSTGSFSRDVQGVAFYQWNKLMDGHVDVATGERVGPLLRVIQIQQIESSFVETQDRKLHLESMVERAHGNTNHCPMHYEELCGEYVDLFEVAEKEAEERLREEEEMKNKACKERREEKQARKMERVRAIYDLLEEYLGEDCPEKEMALECEWREEDYQECLKFKCTIVDGAMKSMVSAPSSSSDRQIKDAANRIRDAFTALDEKKFFTYNFISESSHRYKKGLYEYCTTETDPLTILSSTQADSTFISLVEQNQLTKALIRVLSYNRNEAMSRAFALAVVRTNPNAAESQERIENYRSLASRVWKKKNNSYGTMTLATVKESYNTCLEEFKVVKRNARDYLAHEQTAAFLRRDSINQVGDFTRQMAINQVFTPATLDQYFSSEGRRINAYDALRNKNFDSLRIVHEAYFRRPSQYNMNVNND